MSTLTVPTIATDKTVVVMLVDVDVTVVNVVKVEVVVKKAVVAVWVTVEVCPANKATATNTADRLPQIDRIIKLTLRHNL